MELARALAASLRCVRMPRMDRWAKLSILTAAGADAAGWWGGVGLPQGTR